MLALQLTGSRDHPELIVGDVTPPEAAPGRVIVDVAFAGVTKTEPHWSTNWRPNGEPRDSPTILGLEFSGTILSIGTGVQGFTPGRRVFGSTEADHGGALAERVSVAASMLVQTPSRVSDVDAGVLGLGGATAWQAIVRYGELQRHQRVLIHGGAGGVGAIAVQIASWVGAHVTVTAAAKDTILCKSLGADEVIDFEHERFEVMGGRYDLVFDQIGGDVLERSWGVVKPGGRLVTVAGEKEPDQARAKALGITALYFVFDNKPEELRALADLVAEGRVRPVIGRRIDLARADQAFSEHSGGTPGKTVVRCSPE